MSGRAKPGRAAGGQDAAVERLTAAIADGRALARELHELIQEARDVQRAWKEDKHDFAGDLDRHFREQISQQSQQLITGWQRDMARATGEIEMRARRIGERMDEVYDHLAQFTGTADSGELLDRILSDAARHVAETLLPWVQKAVGKGVDAGALLSVLSKTGNWGRQPEPVITVTDDPELVPPGSLVLDMRKDKPG